MRGQRWRTGSSRSGKMLGMAGRGSTATLLCVLVAAIGMAPAGCGGGGDRPRAAATPTPAKPTRAEPSEIAAATTTLELSAA